MSSPVRGLLVRIDQLFTAFTDRLTWALGLWPMTVGSALLLVLWTVYCAVQLGGDWFTSPEYNFPLNTVTTCGEWFLGCWLAAAANRQERRNRELLEAIRQMLEQESADIGDIEGLLAQDRALMDELA